MKYAVVDYRISQEEIYNLENLGYKVLKCPKSCEVYEAINGHPDIQMHIVDEKNIIIQKNINKEFLSSLESLGYNLIKSKYSLKNKYPGDIILNAYSDKRYFIHNTLYTDPNLWCLLHGFDALRLPYGDVLLPGFNYGFIGGCGGLTPQGEMCFFGDLKYYKYKDEIIHFLYKYDIKPIYLYDGPLLDRGSLLII